MNNVIFVACWALTMSYFAPDFFEGFGTVILFALVVGAVFLDLTKR